MAVCNEIQALRKKATESAAELVRIRSAQAQLEPWMRLDVPLRFAGTAKTTAFIGTLPGTFTTEELYAALDAPERAFDAEILSASAEQTCIFLLCPKGQADEMEQALRALGFAGRRRWAVGSRRRSMPRSKRRRRRPSNRRTKSAKS